MCKDEFAASRQKVPRLIKSSQDQYWEKKNVSCRRAREIRFKFKSSEL